MIDVSPFLADIAWPFTIFIAWVAGELGYRLAKLPRISVYALVGFLLAPTQSGLLPESQASNMLLLANIAFGLILFECGYRINLHWLRANPWIAVSSLAEALLTFVSIYFLVTWFGHSTSTALLLAALSMATSPATIVRVINEQRSSGQVTERMLHHSAMNCVLAVFVFKVILGLVVFQTSGNVWSAMYSSLVVLAASVLLGALAGVLVSALLRFTKRTSQDSTLAFTMATICLVALAHSLKLSPVLVALTFGLSVRHRRIALNASQRGFGLLGDLMSVLLFVFIASTVQWQQVLAGMGLGLLIIAVRQIAKTVGIGLFAHASGISWRKGLIIGTATIPLSAFVILVLEESRYLGINLLDPLAPLAAAALTVEVLGPVVIRRALIWAREVPDNQEADRAA